MISQLLLSYIFTFLGRCYCRYQTLDHESMPVKDETEEIRKYKQLLDDGIITTEEFEVKKKQILNLYEDKELR